MAAACPIEVVAVVGHSKVIAGPTAAAPPVVAHTVAVGVAGPIAAGHIATVAIEAAPPVVDYTVAEVALVAIVDYP